MKGRLSSRSPLSRVRCSPSAALRYWTPPRDRPSCGSKSTGPHLASPWVIRPEPPPSLEPRGTLIEQMRRQGYPFAAVPGRRVIVDHATRQMEIRQSAEPGPYARFGQIAVIGLEEMNEDFVRDRFDLAPDNPFSLEAVRRIRDNLAGLDVFSRIGLETADDLIGDDRLPLTVNLTERPRRAASSASARISSHPTGSPGASIGDIAICSVGRSACGYRRRSGVSGRMRRKTSNMASAFAIRRLTSWCAIRLCRRRSWQGGRPLTHIAVRRSRSWLASIAS